MSVVIIATDRGPLPSFCQLHHPQLWAQTLPQPLDALLLWVHDQRPTLAGCQNGSVLDGHPIVWQALVVPGSHGGIICKHEDGIQAACQGHRGLRQTEGRCQWELSECWPQFAARCCSQWGLLKVSVYLLGFEERDPNVIQELQTILPGEVT